MLKLFILITTTSLLLFSCNNSSAKKESNILTVFHAGSMSVPLKQVVEAFEKEYPAAKVLLESAGSVKCARKITDLNRKCDVMVSADYSIINEMLIPKFASWNIKFAGNEMCIVYNNASAYANDINKNNWYDILLKEDVAYGRSDPDSDPCGYRAVLVSKLAESYYSLLGFSTRLMMKDRRHIRPKEVDLLALLETNVIDYIFLYRSVAEQHELKYLILPNEINLKVEKFADLYNNATVSIVGDKPVVKNGESMAYGITVLDNSPNKNMAIAFVKFMLEKDKGMVIIERNGQPSVIPSQSYTFSKIPAELQVFAIEKK